MANQYTDHELERLMHEADERAHGGRLERLRILLSEASLDPVPFAGLAYEYYEEARLCWYVGAFVAAIVMAQLAFEETLRSHYRVAKGVGGNLNEYRKLDDAGFANLIEQATDDGWLSAQEAAALHGLRKDYRNPYVHPRDFSKDNDFSKPNFLRQLVKIAAGGLLEEGVEEEARETIRLLITLLPTISSRMLLGSESST